MHRYWFWRDVRAVYPPSRLLFLILQVAHRIVVAVAAGKLEQHRNRIETPRADRCANLRFVWHISLWLLRCDVHSGFSGAASASNKGPALMDLGGDARVQSIPRAANRTYGAEDTR